MPKHIVRLLMLLAAIVLLGLAARYIFVEPSFYRYGHYRGDAVLEIAAAEPQYRGPAYCRDCHAERYRQWAAGIHNRPELRKVVKCEACHGPAGGHPANAKMPVPRDTQKLCTQCHEAMPGRPAEQRQITVAMHAGVQQCIACHNPHSPKIDFAALPPSPLSAAKAGATIAAGCRGCHGQAGISDNPDWPNLAGQHPGYLLAALKAFKSGARSDPMMSGVAAAMSEADMRDVAAYFGTSRCQVAGADPARAALGKARSATCTGCHGAGGVSGNPEWPNLSGQHPGYLGAALRSFQTARNHPVMTSVATALSETDIDNLAAYYASSACK